MDDDNKVIHSSFWANLFNRNSTKDGLDVYLKETPFFRKLNTKDISLILSLTHSRSYMAGECIFFQGDPGIGLYIILEGEVIIKRKEEDNVIPLATFREGDFFGELALVDGEKRSASSIAKTDCKLAVIFKPDLDEFIEKYPKKGLLILRGINDILAVRLRTINEDFFKLRSKPLLSTESDYGIQY